MSDTFLTNHFSTSETRNSQTDRQTGPSVWACSLFVDPENLKMARNTFLLLALLLPHTRLRGVLCLLFRLFYSFERLSSNVRHAERSNSTTSLLPQIKRTCFAAVATLLIIVLRLLESASWGSWFLVDSAAERCCGPRLAICLATVLTTGGLRYVPSCLHWMENFSLNTY